MAEIGPTTVLDAGCAMGFLVEALRDRGVQAYGLDVSEYAIDQVRADIKQYCTVGSLTDTLTRSYDLIACIEVLEHLKPAETVLAARNICAHTDDLLFSSTSDDYKEATHVNVRPPEYWGELFAQQEFYRDVDHDASYMAAWAIRLRRGRDPVTRQIGNYERFVSRLRVESQSLRELAAEHRRQLADQDERLQQLQREVTGARVVTQTLTYRLAGRMGGGAGRMFPRSSRRGRAARWLASKLVRGR